MNCFCMNHEENIISIIVLELTQWDEWLEQQSGFVKNWIDVQQIKAEPGVCVLLPSAQGELSQAIFLLETKNNLWAYAEVVNKLPAGNYQFKNLLAEQYNFAAIAWGLESYCFNLFKSEEKIADKSQSNLKNKQKLFLPEDVVDSVWIGNYVAAHCYIRYSDLFLMDKYHLGA